VGGGADAGVEDDGHVDRLPDDGQVVGVADAHAGADGRTEGHDGGTAAGGEASGRDRIVVGVGQDDEPVVDEVLGGGDQLDGIGQQRVLVADDLELHPVGTERLPGEAGGGDGLRRGAAPGRVGQDPDPGAVEYVEQRWTS